MQNITDYDVWGWSDGTITKHVSVSTDPPLWRVQLYDSNGPKDDHWLDLLDSIEAKLRSN